MKKIIFYFSLIFCIYSYGDNTLKSEEPKGAISHEATAFPHVALYQYHRKLDKNNDRFYYDTRIIVESDKGQRDGAVCYVWPKDLQAPGTVPLYQYSSPHYSIFYYDTNPFAEYKGQRDGIVCYIYKDSQDGLIPLYEYAKYTSYWGNLYYYDTRSSVEPDKGSRTRIVGYVFPQ
jgi:hypothetical protein